MPVDRIANLPAGTHLFIDANIFIYAFLGHSGWAVIEYQHFIFARSGEVFPAPAGTLSRRAAMVIYFRIDTNRSSVTGRVILHSKA